MRETLYPQVRLNLYVIEKEARSMSTKEQKGGQALSNQTRLFGSLKTTPTEDPIKTTYSQQEGPPKQFESNRNV